VPIPSISSQKHSTHSEEGRRPFHKSIVGRIIEYPATGNGTSKGQKPPSLPPSKDARGIFGQTNKFPQKRSGHNKSAVGQHHFLHQIVTAFQFKFQSVSSFIFPLNFGHQFFLLNKKVSQILVN
jgi:hypothetical protein